MILEHNHSSLNSKKLIKESSANNTVAKCFPPQRLLPTHVAFVTPSKDGLFFPQLATRKSQLSLLGRNPNGEMGRTTARTAIGREEGKHGAYYDAKIGRFLQADSEIQPDEPNGMNRMMYVHGKPLQYTDQTGKKLSTPLANALIEYFFAPVVFTVGLFMTAAGVIVKCGASGYKANFIDKNASESTYLSYSYSNPSPPSQENKPGPRPPDTRTLIQTSQAEKEDSPSVACSGG
jgi:hypothetical protein